MAFPKRVTRLSQLIADTITGGTLIGTYLSSDSPAHVRIRDGASGGIFEWWNSLGDFIGNAVTDTDGLTITFGGTTVRLYGAGLLLRVIYATQVITLQGPISARDCIKMGTVDTGVMVAGTDKTINVNLPWTPYPDNTYSVFFSIREPTNNGRFSVTYSGKTNADFNIVVNRSIGTASFTVDWIAIRTV